MNLPSRIRGHAPQLTTLMLCALSAAELIRGALALRSEHAERPASRSAPPHDTRMALDTQHIVAAHLFGMVESAVPISELHAANANLRLDGTLATEDPRRGLAIIHDGQAPKFYSVGGVVDGASLERVYWDHVILSRAGVLEILKLPRPGGSLQRGALTASASASAPAARGFFVDSQGRAVDKQPGKFDGIIRTIQTMDPQTGKMRGFVVYPVGNGAPLHLLGLSPADLITAINGTPLDDPKRAQEILAQIQSSDSANVTIERQNQKMDLVVNVAAATERVPAIAEEP
jgi:general secretion pathway protein C